MLLSSSVAAGPFTLLINTYLHSVHLLSCPKLCSEMTEVIQLKKKAKIIPKTCNHLFNVSNMCVYIHKYSKVSLLPFLLIKNVYKHSNINKTNTTGTVNDSYFLLLPGNCSWQKILNKTTKYLCGLQEPDKTLITVGLLITEVYYTGCTEIITIESMWSCKNTFQICNRRASLL